MKRFIDPDPIIIRYDHKYDQIVAFLPTQPANYGNILCYTHVGQHSEASVDYYRNTVKVPLDKEPKAEALIAELKSIGYNVKRYQKMSGKLYDQQAGVWRA